MNTIKCIVAAHNATGEPDLYFCQVRCTQAQYDNGDHYVRARQAARDDGYEGEMVIFDEFDTAGQAMLGLFCWDSVAESILCSVPEEGSP
jgi:hypothetical protein